MVTGRHIHTYMASLYVTTIKKKKLYFISLLNSSVLLLLGELEKGGEKRV